METHLTEENLKKLRSYYKYYYFEKGESGCNHALFYSDIREEIEVHYRDLRNISDKLIKGLCFIYNKKINNPTKFDNEFCSYLYYWLGHNIFPNLSNKTLFSKIITMIYQVLELSGMHNVCQPIYKEIHEETFNRYKLLFDYSQDHQNIKLSTSNAYTTCNQEYKKFIQNYINTYRDAYSKCEIERTNKYDCVYFNKLFEKYEHTDLNSFHCVQHNVQTHSADEEEVIEPSRLSLSMPRTSSETPDSVIYTNPKGNNGQILNHNLHEYRGLAGRQVLGSHVPMPTDETDESGSTKTIMGSVVPVLGVSSFSLLLYKVNINIVYIHRIVIYV
ncbi:hypothetical protein PVNG_05992 [Plasmodium vivax North Korean]|uniref:Variable surface protein Vir7-like protein n=1 Tax=Plasmodium vivax North Korean TaxID=1035514 RepID=A0A0J9W6D0_PLAVI|nr:hypothetical protein PVNG_05992 [Plasmodium vivax North Korean]